MRSNLWKFWSFLKLRVVDIFSCWLVSQLKWDYTLTTITQHEQCFLKTVYATQVIKKNCFCHGDLQVSCSLVESKLIARSTTELALSVALQPRKWIFCDSLSGFHSPCLTSYCSRDSYSFSLFSILFLIILLLLLPAPTPIYFFFLFLWDTSILHWPLYFLVGK